MAAFFFPQCLAAPRTDSLAIHELASCLNEGKQARQFATLALELLPGCQPLIIAVKLLFHHAANSDAPGSFGSLPQRTIPLAPAL